MGKNVFISAMPLDNAVSIWLSALGRIERPPSETVNVRDAIGMVTASAVSARISSPFFHSSAMDGYAVKHADTFGASETSPKRLEIGRDAVYADTGDPLPEGMNAVIMIEDVNKSGNAIEIIAPATPWQNVRPIGEDIVATELILPENHIIRPMDASAMLAGGHTEVAVRKKPRITIIPTGDEIVEPGSALKTGDIIEFNSTMLGGMASEWGAEFIRHPIVPDDPEKLKSAVSKALADSDMVAVIAGSSAGTGDFTSSVIKEMGELLVHGIAIKPGKPVILGIINKKPVMGVPGYPVSAFLTFGIFGKPAIEALQGLEPSAPEKIEAVLSRQVASPIGQDEFVRVKLGRVGANLIATPLGRGAGLLMSLVRADGILRIPAMSEGLGAGARAEVSLLRKKDAIENTIVSIGSHDNMMDVLANFIKKRHPRLSLSSAHVGSMGGLVALSKGEAHIAPTHMLDEETGVYNTPYIKKLLPGRKVHLINLVHRTQGFIVKKGNPKAIKSFADLARSDVTFINRQRGAGTRLLLDKHLKELGIAPSSIKGYEREEYTHMAVASAVLTGLADVGLGVLSAAQALNLDFVPVTSERYDLAIPDEFINTDMIKALLDIVRNDAEFKNAAVEAGGYGVEDMGRVMEVVG